MGPVPPLASATVEYRVLGPLEVVTDTGQSVRLAGHRHRTILAILLLHAGEVVSLERLLDAVWDGDPPATAKRQVQNCVSTLRRDLAPGSTRPVELVADGPGYRIRPGPNQLDLRVFDDRVAEAGQLASAGRAGDALATLRSALALWRGPALLGLTGQYVEAAAAGMDERRLSALERCLDLELATGRHSAVVGEVTELVAAHPLRERLVGQLMRALHGAGRRADALQAYHRLRGRLGEELGLDPGVELRDLYTELLGDGPVGGSPPASSVAVGDPAPTYPVPAQLPADIAGFTGREEQLKILNELLPDRAGPTPTAVVLVAIAGLAGVGKTALAVHWGHQVRELFPDGQLYLDLRGHADRSPATPAEALARLLGGLGVADDQIPADVEAAAAGYRSRLAGRRVLVILDNAADADQVRPLLPGGSGCLAVVTSRLRLTGLVARDGARPLALDVLPPDDAQRLLAQILGAEAVAAEPDAAADLARACSYLPLALRVAAATLGQRPAPGIAGYLAELRAGDRLAALEIDGDERAGVRRAFDLSYQALPPAAGPLFRRLGLVPGPDLTAPAAATLAEITVDSAARLLSRLASAHLVNEVAPGRFAPHDLLREYAAGLARREDPPAVREAAVRRLGSWYLAGADAAATVLYPQRLRLPVPPDTTGGGPAFDTGPAALAWLDAERANLVATVRYAAADGPPATVWLLADTLRGYFWLRMHTVDWAYTAGLALTVAEAADDPYGQASSLLSLGDTHDRRNDREAAIDCYTRALALAERTRWLPARTAALGKLGVAHMEAGRLPEAADHYRRALDLCEPTGSRYNEAVLLGSLGRVTAQLGDLPAAMDYLTRALELFQAVGSRQGEAAALDALGDLLYTQGRLDEATDRLTRALAIEQEVGDRGTEAYSRRSLAAVHLAAGRPATAVDLVQATLALAREVGDRRIEADGLNTLASIRHHQGRYPEAIEAHRRALALTHATGYRYTEVEALIGLAVAYRDAGEPGRARDHARQALTLAGWAGFRLLRRRASTILADLADATD